MRGSKRGRCHEDAMCGMQNCCKRQPIQGRDEWMDADKSYGSWGKERVIKHWSVLRDEYERGLLGR